jgi:EF hand
MVQEIDTDGNGVIDYNEFLTVMTKRRLVTTSTTEIRAAFGKQGEGRERGDRGERGREKKREREMGMGNLIQF